MSDRTQESPREPAARLYLRMRGSFKNGFYGGVLAAFIIGLWFARLWSAENQVRLHSEHLLREVEDRSWSGVREAIAPDYHDAWGDDRMQLLTRLRSVSLMLLSLSIETQDVNTSVNGDSGTWSARLQITAQGEAAAEVRARVNPLTSPFTLHWRRESWKPWDWQLYEVSNPQLRLPNESE